MKTTKRSIEVSLALLFVLATLQHAGGAVRLSSPDASLEIAFDVRSFQTPLPEGRHICYWVTYHGQVLIEPSPIRLEPQGDPPIGKNVKIAEVVQKDVDEISEPLYGKTRFLVDRCRQATIVLEQTEERGRFYMLEARAYDDAVAFRLGLPFQPGFKSLILTAEKTYVRLPKVTAYALTLEGFRTSYENNYTVGPLEQIDDGKLIGLPALFQTASKVWIAVTEAGLYDFPGMYLSTVPGSPNTLVTRLAPRVDRPEVAAFLSAPHALPWRVLLISDHPGKMIESNVVLCLSEPSRIESPCWIKPGKVAWPWWSRRAVTGAAFKGGMNTETMKYYTDFAADAGLQYLLIDAGWYGDHRDAKANITTTIPEIDMPEIVHYARSRGVDVILWVNWHCVDRQMEEAFPLYEKWGVKGVKVDYMNRDDQEMVNFYERVVKQAARYHLVVDFHGAFKPTGLRRTYPNLLTREGVLGLEYSKWSDRCSPDHDVMLPFTRMLAGPMDFTPGAFNVGSRASFQSRSNPPMAQGTRAHQLAMYVVYESPLQMLVDHPASYWSQPGFEFLRVVPTVWDETHFVDGAVGDYVVLARRHGEDWYMGCMTDWTSRDLSVPLQFLGNGKYVAQIYEDAPEAGSVPTRVNTRLTTVSAADSLRVHLAPGGGCAVRFLRSWQR